MSRKLKYGEPTKTVGFKVPLSKEKELRLVVENYLLKIQRDYEKPTETQVKDFIGIIRNRN